MVIWTSCHAKGRPCASVSGRMMSYLVRTYDAPAHTVTKGLPGIGLHRVSAVSTPCSR